METTVVANNLKEKFLSDFEKTFELRTNESEGIQQKRKNALEIFSSLDFPSKRDENWKYTNIRPVFKTPFEKTDDNNLNHFNEYLVPFDESISLVFVNGNFNSKLSVNPVQGLLIKTMSDAIAENPEMIEKYLGSQADLNTDIFPSMNTMLFNDGVFVYIPEGIVLEKPIQLIYISGNTDTPIASYPRNVFVAAKNSKFSVVEISKTLKDSTAGFVNSLTEIVIEESASAVYYKIQNDADNMCHIDTVYATQAANSNLSVYTVTLNAGINRNKLNIRHSGTNCETYMNGLSVLGDAQHIDNHTFIDHALPGCYSNELYKNIVDGNAHAVFSGKIMVRKDAQKTNAFQSCKNILLSEGASVDAMPQLEIFADDVKCSHGATTGRLNDEAMFYLQSRGIGADKAKALLIYAFAAEVFESVSIPALKTALGKMLEEKLGTEL